MLEYTNLKSNWEYIIATKYSNAIEAAYMKHNTKENSINSATQK